MVHLTEDVQSLGIVAPKFELLQQVQIRSDFENGYVFEAMGIICGLLLEHSDRFPVAEMFQDGWCYNVALEIHPDYPRLPKWHREWFSETELLPLD